MGWQWALEGAASFRVACNMKRRPWSLIVEADRCSSNNQATRGYAVITDILENANKIKDLAEAIALLAAAAFFFWKLISGYLVANLTITPTLHRARSNGNNDSLLTTINLVKGDRESLLLQEVKITITGEKGTIVSQNLNSPRVENSRRLIRLSPSETAQFDHLCMVPTGETCEIEIAIKGTSGFIPLGPVTRGGFWKVHKISLPV